jgi:hypothetical protein
MPTLILTPRQTEDAQSLWRAALARGWDVERLTTWRIPEDLRSAPEPVLYVEALFGPTLADELGVQLLSPAEDWLPALPLAYRRREVQLSTLGRARRLPAPAFIKPPNDKSFPAAVYAPSELPSAFDDDMAVLVSEPVRFVSEFRCFVLDRRVRAFSLYAREGTPCPTEVHTEAEARAIEAFVGAMLASPDVALPRACALDVGVVDGRGWSVVELNAAWGAGIYRCDPEAVLDVVRAATISRPEPAQ